MDWTEITVKVALADAEVAQAIASMTVPYGIYIEDYSDMEAVLPEVGWVDVIDEALLAKDRAHAIIHVYLPKENNPAEAVAFITERLKTVQIDYKLDTATIHENDWANNWKQYYKPERIGERLVVCPSWEQYEPKADDVMLTLDPGAAFGTGQHETTRLCLLLLEQAVLPGSRVLDVGCGSGILSIAALKLGAKEATAVDIDPYAAATARQNALENGFEDDRYHTVAGNLLADSQLCNTIGGAYDVIAANIVADVILAMKALFYAKLETAGTLLVSGIIDARADEVEQALVQAGFGVAERRELRGWVALRMQKAIA